MEISENKISVDASISVRNAELKDADIICSFINELEDENFDPKIFSELLAVNLASANNIYLVAVDDDKVIGFISCHGQINLHHLGWIYEIVELFVAAPYRNKKVGALLLQRLEEILSTRQYTVLEVDSNRKRLDSHRFYLNNGFTQSHFKFTKIRH